MGTPLSSSAAEQARIRVPGARRPGPEQQPAVSGGRRRRLGWAWAGAGAVVVSAVGFALVAQEVGQRTAVLEVAHDVAPGAVLKADDLRVVKVAAESGVVPVSRRARVLGHVVRTPLAAGSLLAPGQVGERADFPPTGFSQVALAVEAGGAPPDLSRGERVALLPGPALEGSGVEVDGEGVAPEPVVVGTVTAVQAPESAGGPRVVTVLVETGAARRAAGLVSPRVVVLPAQGREAP